MIPEEYMLTKSPNLWISLIKGRRRSVDKGSPPERHIVLQPKVFADHNISLNPERLNSSLKGAG